MAATKTASKSTVKTAQPLVNDLPLHANTDDMQFNLRDFMAMAGVTLPSWKRVAVLFIATLASGYLIGSAASVVMNILFAGAMTVTGSLFVAWMLYAVALIAAIAVAVRASMAISRYILGGKADEHVAAVRAKVPQFSLSFGSKPVAA